MYCIVTYVCVLMCMHAYKTECLNVYTVLMIAKKHETIGTEEWRMYVC